jgi:hypothetical protein
MRTVQYEDNPLLSNDELNALWTAAWPDHTARDFVPVLGRSLVYIVARCERRLIGFVNVA